MTAFRSLSLAILKGYLRDKQDVFFTVVFPLMFLVLFGGAFANQSQSKLELVQVGEVSLIESMPERAREAFDDAFAVSKEADQGVALEQVREGDAALAVEQRGNEIVVHYSDADRVTSSVAQGTLQSFVQAANLSATGVKPVFTYTSERVEDESLETIQFVTPGLLGWAIATSATFGAAATLVGWRSTRLLRRLRLTPVSTRTLVAARIGVTVLIAMVQTVIFVGLAVAFFGLELNGSWWMAVLLLVCGTLSFMSLGLFVGAISNTVGGATGLANILVLPMAFLSGSFFPLDGAPRWLDIVSRALPLRHLNDGMLDVMVRGQGPEAALLPIGILVGFAAVVLLIASRFFSWETD